MANQQGFSAAAGVGSLAKLFAHFDRTKMYDKDGNLKYVKYDNLTVRGFDRRTNTSEIDPSRTHLNYNLAPEREGGQAAFVERRLAEIYVHKSALKNAVVDWAVTLPALDQYEGREREFFQVCYDRLVKKFGEENVVSAYVHWDETTPHMHFVYMPIVPDKKHEQGFKLSKKDSNTVRYTVIENGRRVEKENSAAFSAYVHFILDQAVCTEMGFERSGITLTPDERTRKRAAKYEMTMPEYKEVQQMLAQTRAEVTAETERLESVRRSITSIQGEIDRVEGEIGIEERRIEELDERNRQARGRIEDLRDRIAAFADRAVNRLEMLVKRGDAAFRRLCGSGEKAPDGPRSAAAPYRTRKQEKTSLAGDRARVTQPGGRTGTTRGRGWKR